MGATTQDQDNHRDGDGDGSGEAEHLLFRRVGRRHRQYRGGECDDSSSSSSSIEGDQAVPLRRVNRSERRQWLQHGIPWKKKAGLVLVLVAVMVKTTAVLFLLWGAPKFVFHANSANTTSSPTVRAYQLVSLIPVVLTAISAFQKLWWASSARTRTTGGGGSGHRQVLSDGLLSLALAAAVACAQLPLFAGAFVACAALLAFALATIPGAPLPKKVAGDDPRAAGPIPSALFTTTTATTTTTTSITPLQIIASVVLLLAVLLTENFMVWVVSATFPAGQQVETAPPPLQDNGRFVLLNFLLHSLTRKQVVGGLRRLWNVQWGLVGCFATSLGVVEVLHHPQRQMYGLARRAVFTLALARVLRTVSFLLTVLPSQVPSCYSQRFPVPPPADWLNWIQVGLLPASHGGCNDLIVSGHATVVTTLACTATSVSKDRMFQFTVWLLVIMDFCVEVYEGFHYSVDMWLGLVLGCLIWRALNGAEFPPPHIALGSDSTFLPAPGTSQSQQPPYSTKRFASSVSRRDAIWFSAPAGIAYLQATGLALPKAWSNAMIVAYVLLGVVGFVRSSLRRRRRRKGAPAPSSDAPPPAAALLPDPGENYDHAHPLSVHYAQHLLLCAAFLALVTYL
jgi:hypothetical protein